MTPKPETAASLVTKPKLSDIVKTDATVDMNSIVAYFISKYELSLFEQKKLFSDKIKDLKKYLSDGFITEVEADIKLSSFNFKIKPLNIDIVATLHIDQNALSNKKVYIQFSTESREFHFSGNKIVTVSDEVYQKYVDTTDAINAASSELTEVLNKIQNITRKEREIRGALAEKTLRDAGVEGLFDAPELLNLITLPTISIKTVTEEK